MQRGASNVVWPITSLMSVVTRSNYSVTFVDILATKIQFVGTREVANVPLVMKMNQIHFSPLTNTTYWWIYVVTVTRWIASIAIIFLSIPQKQLIIMNMYLNRFKPQTFKEASFSDFSFKLSWPFNTSMFILSLVKHSSLCTEVVLLCTVLIEEWSWSCAFFSIITLL